MIILNLSRDLAKDLAGQLDDVMPPAQSPQRWYAHRITLNRRRCVIAMEAQSRYAMTFCGLVKQDFQHFSELFQERLWKEALALCPGLEDDDMALLSDFILTSAQQVHYQVGHDRSVGTHIRQVSEELDVTVNYNAWGFPETNAAHIKLDLRLNSTLRRIGKKNDCFIPLEVFRDGWLVACGLDYRAVEKFDFFNSGGPPRLAKMSAQVYYPDFQKTSKK